MLDTQSVLFPTYVNSCVREASAAIRVGGRPSALSAAQKVEVRQIRDQQLRPLPEIAQLFRVSVKTPGRPKPDYAVMEAVTGKTARMSESIFD
jgi:hypothetical protein